MKLHGYDIEVGDKVWGIKYGYGEIGGLDKCGAPYQVLYETGDEVWCYENELFWQPFDIPAHAYQKPKKLVQKGIVVYKRPNGSFDCTFYKETKKEFETKHPHLTFIEFVIKTVEMVEE